MKITGRNRLMLAIFAIMAGSSFLTRTVLLLKSLPNLDLSPILLLKIYLTGFFFDSVTASYALIPFALAAIIIPNRIHNSRLSRTGTQIFFFLFTFAMLFNGVAEYIFFDEFATRFNFIAVDYLIYTTEVIKNIQESYPVALIIGSLLVITLIPFLSLRRYLAGSFPDTTSWRRRAAGSTILLVLPLMSYFAVTLSLSEIAPNNYANELAGNGLYGFVAAFRNNELEYNRYYLTKEQQVIMAKLRSMLGSNDRRGISRKITGRGAQKHYNIILVCEESLSAEFLGAFGSKRGITPNLDRLAKESLFFTHLYATGTRTIRGLEALTLSMPPLPGTAIVKRPGNENFLSLGEIMKQRGYDNHFIYGGRGYFDNMNYFFANNGFAIIDQNNFSKEEITFKNAWGVCDEDLFDKTIKQAGVSYKANKPFFSFLMTTSNHRPYTFPDGKIDMPSGRGGRDGAVKYTDYAIGKLIEKSRKEPWFKDTIFVIVADHCAGSARKLALPIKDYEIPLFIYAPEILKPQTIDRMMSQIDIPPTILGLLNINYNSKFFGRDIFNETAGPEHAFIATYQKLGYIEDDKLLILSPQKRSEFYRFSRNDGKTTVTAVDEQLLLNGLAWYQGSAVVYRDKLNRTTP